MIATAYHEAGHALAAWHGRLPIRECSIVPDDGAGTLGHVTHHPSPTSFQPDVASATELRNRARIEAHVVTSLAGTFAARLVSARVSSASWETDRNAAVDLLDYLVGSKEELQAYLGWLTVRARQLAQAEHLRPALDALAAALLEHRRLSGREARRIIRDALLSVDSVIRAHRRPQRRRRRRKS